MTDAEIDDFFREQLSKALRAVFEVEVERLKQEGEHEQNIQEAESQDRQLVDQV